MCGGKWVENIAREIWHDSTWLGHFWYVITFIFRLLVVITLGWAIFGDERSGFVCNQISFGCSTACFNQFQTVTHLQFWAFQMLAVISPVILFHMLATFIRFHFAKVRETKKQLANTKDQLFANRNHRRYEKTYMRLREIIVGAQDAIKVLDRNELKEIFTNTRIKILYCCSVALRCFAEGFFVFYLTRTYYDYPLFIVCSYSDDVGRHDQRNVNKNSKALKINFTVTSLKERQNQNYVCIADTIFRRQDPTPCLRNTSGLDFLVAEYPEFYPCRRLDEAILVDIACAQQVAPNGHVPCWTSRAHEKTLFLRYMNILSAICFFLCIVELLFVLIILVLDDLVTMNYRTFLRHQREMKELMSEESIITETAPLNAQPSDQIPMQQTQSHYAQPSDQIPMQQTQYSYAQPSDQIPMQQTQPSYAQPSDQIPVQKMQTYEA